MAQIEKEVAGGTTSPGANDGSTSGLNSADDASDTAGEGSLVAMLQKLLEDLLNIQQYHQTPSHPESQDSKSVNSYA